MGDSLRMVRAGPNAAWTDDFISKRIVAVGLVDVGPPGLGLSATEIRRRVAADHPAWKDRKVQATVAQMRRQARDRRSHNSIEAAELWRYDART